MKKQSICLLLAVTLCLLAGCQSSFSNPLEQAQATLVPGVDASLHSPIAGPNDTDTFTAELYFRFQTEPYLALEERELTVGRDASLEKAMVQALLDGPSAASPELKRCFSDQVRVISADSQGSLLYVTLSQELLQPYADERAAGQEEIRIRRQLSMQSLAATIIENLNYDAVQVLVQQTGSVSSGMRLPLSYYQQGKQGTATPLMRDEAWLMSPKNTADILLSLWAQKDWERLYQYFTLHDPATGAARPSQADAYTELDQGKTLAAFDVGDGQVSLTGQRATVACSLSLQLNTGQELSVFPSTIRLYRENGIWKTSYSQWIALMSK